MVGLLGPGPPGPRRLARPCRAGARDPPTPTRPPAVPERAGGAPGARGAAAGARRHPLVGRRQPGASPRSPTPWRTCFERDRDRILHATSFRRLAGKTQVFVFPQDHQRTRLTHALEVAQVATAIARACRLNVALTEAIALGHDCGHGPGRPRQRGRARPLRARWLRPRALGGARRPWPRSTCAPRRSTASPTTAGPARPRPPPRARS